MEYTAKELEAKPTLSQGQADDLKIDEGDKRVWLSRVNEGEISVERRVDGKWGEPEVYPG